MISSQVGSDAKTDEIQETLDAESKTSTSDFGYFAR